MGGGYSAPFRRGGQQSTGNERMIANPLGSAGGGDGRGSGPQNDRRERKGKKKHGQGPNA